MGAQVSDCFYNVVTLRSPLLRAESVVAQNSFLCRLHVAIGSVVLALVSIIRISVVQSGPSHCFFPRFCDDLRHSQQECIPRSLE